MNIKRKGEAGWIESRNRWQISVQKDGVRKCFTSSVAGKKGKHEAEAKADEWLSESTEDITFGHAFEEYLAYREQELSAGSMCTIAAPVRAIKARFKPSTKLYAITLYDWQTAYKAMCEGYTYSTCKIYRNVLTNFASYCERRRWKCEKLSAKLLPMPKVLADKRDKRALTDDELAKLETIDEHDSYLAYGYRLLPLTGLRISELRALQWQDIDFAAGLLHVNRGADRFDNINDGKTCNARRTVPLTAHACDLLHLQQAFQRSRGVITPWVFDDVGGLIGLSKAQCEWRRVLLNYLHYKISLHELRHTFISRMKSELALPILKQVVGHSFNMDTIGVYGHEIDGDMLTAAVAMQRLEDARQK